MSDDRSVPHDTDLIDLRATILDLIEYIPFISAISIAVAFIVCISQFSRPIMYRTMASVVITQSKMELLLEPKFKDVSSEVLAGSKSYADDQRAALEGLVMSPSIAKAVIAELGERLPTELRDVTKLMGMIGSEPEQGHLIQIVARGPDSETVALVANTWASEYVERANQAYGYASAASTEVIRDLALAARADYEVAEQALIDFQRQDRSQELSRLVKEKQLLIGSLQEGRETAFKEQVAAKQGALADHYATRRRLAGLFDDAEALQGQVQKEGPGGSATSNLPVVLLKMEVYASTSALPAEVQLQLGDVVAQDRDPSALIADLDAMQEVLENRIEALDAVIAEESLELFNYQVAALPDSSDEWIATLEQDVRSLRAELEQESARGQELSRARNTAWETHATVARKQAEVRIGSALVNTTVRVAALAVPPTRPEPREMPRWALVGGGLGAMLATAVALFVRFLYPDFDPRALLRRRSRNAGL